MFDLWREFLLSIGIKRMQIIQEIKIGLKRIVKKIPLPVNNKHLPAGRCPTRAFTILSRTALDTGYFLDYVRTPIQGAGHPNDKDIFTTAITYIRK